MRRRCGGRCLAGRNSRSGQPKPDRIGDEDFAALCRISLRHHRPINVRHHGRTRQSDEWRGSAKDG